ncbi:MAG: 30S ribosomal protein S4 [bacterium]
MARDNGPKNKIARRIGEDLGLKTNTKSLERRLLITPGQHGKKGRGKQSDYAIQLMEKQKAKAIYGILERQFRNYYIEASRNPLATGEVMLSLLERRLDNCVYRLGFTPTRRAARQLVAHGNVQVDGKKMTIPSYPVKEGQVISLSETAINIPYIKDSIARDGYVTPTWLERKAAVGNMVRKPVRADFTENINDQLIVEFYSR